MTGKIELKVRKGKSWVWCFSCKSGFKTFGFENTICPICKESNLGQVYNYYPEWYIEVTDEDDKTKKVNLSPDWNQIKDFIRDVKIHEIRVDQTRERKKDADNWQEEIEKASEEAQTKIGDFENIRDIYKQQKIIK